MLESNEEPEVNEYSFNEGVMETVLRIQELLCSQDELVIAIAGPTPNDTNLGKTRFSGAISQACMALGIPSVKISSIYNVNSQLIDTIKFRKERAGSKKCVIICEAANTLNCDDPGLHAFHRQATDQQLQEITKPLGLVLKKVDLRVLIYRPDRPITNGARISADLIVRNEVAVDKVVTFFDSRI